MKTTKTKTRAYIVAEMNREMRAAKIGMERIHLDANFQKYMKEVRSYEKPNK